MLAGYTNEIKAAFVASYVFFFYGLNVAFSADIENLIPNKTINVTEESFIGSINVYATAFSCLVVGYLANTIGRKNVICISMLMNLTGWAIMTFFLFNIETVYLSRVFCGICSGLRGASTLYISETSNKIRRGKLLAFGGLTTSLGVSLAYIIQYFFSSKILALVAFIISLVGFIQACFLYETKYYLLMKNDLQNAQNSMLWFDQTMTLDEVHQEMEDIQAQQIDIKPGVRVFKIFTQSASVKSLIISLGIYVLRSFGSRIVITAYPHKFYALFMLPVSVGQMTMIQGANEIIWSACSIFVVDSYPRKFLLNLCCWAMNACLLVFYFQVALVGKTGKFGELLIFLTLTAYSGIISGFLMDLSTICISEIASSNSEYRAIIFSIVQFFGGLSAAIYTNLYPLMVASLSAKCIFVFMASGIAGLSLVVSFVPETLGKALHKCDWQESKNQQDYLLAATSESDVSICDEEASKPLRR